jgi:hypothetical protein
VRWCGRAALVAAVRSAANCSSAARETPLHFAAEGGRAVTVRRLLALGAAVREANRTTAWCLYYAE